jgi:hypothetical protein
MAKKISNNGTDRISSRQIGSIVDEIVSSEAQRRAKFERRWYDNNFFDDGFHFRYVSRETGRIVDLTTKKSFGFPMRAIPKASRQIRGVANLLAGPKYVPVVYPEKVIIQNYPRQAIDPQTGQVMYPDYENAKKNAKLDAQRTGIWLEQYYSKLDINNKIILMMLLAAKQGVSFMKIYPNTKDEEIEAYVCDAFDVYLEGDRQVIYDSPFITFTKKELISKIKANEDFDLEQRMSINADNKYASSEIKEAYMQARYGAKLNSDYLATLIQKETYLKEYITEFNAKKVFKDLKDSDMDLQMGDIVIRQVYSAGGVTLYDKYVDLPEYPVADFRFEPGAIYQVPLIERFIPANKTLNMLVSRIEGYANTMVTGVYQKRKGENYRVSNMPGGQMIEYEATPLTQMNMAGIPPFMFNFIQMIEKFIEEQGSSISALNQLPEGVRSGVAIESLKSTEYANLQIATEQVKKTVKTIAERMINIASKYFIQPQTVQQLNKGEPEYFDVIGQRGFEAYKRIGEQGKLGDVTVVKGDLKIDIEIESGLGFTIEGKKQTMQQIANYFLQLAQAGMIDSNVLKVVIQKLLEIYQFGSTQEFMDVLDEGVMTGGVTEQDILKMKTAMAEVVKDAGLAGEPQEQQQVTSTKVGVVEALRDLAGGTDATTQG